MGVALVRAVYKTADGIEVWPRMGALIPNVPTSRVVRRYPVARFPYHLVGVATDDEIYIVAVAHNRRRPRYWSQRLEGLKEAGIAQHSTQQTSPAVSHPVPSSSQVPRSRSSPDRASREPSTPDKPAWRPSGRGSPKRDDFGR